MFIINPYIFATTITVPAEGEYLFDSSNSNNTGSGGSGYDGTDSNISYITGIIGSKAADFNGTTSSIEINGAVSTASVPSNVYSITRDFSVGGWINVDSVSGNKELQSFYWYVESASIGRGIIFRVRDDELRLMLYDSSNNRTILTTNAMNLSANTDYFIAFTRNGATAKFYMGEKGQDDLTTYAFTNTETALNTNNIGWSDSGTSETSNMDIGRQKSSIADTNYMDGTIDDWRIDNSEWSLAQVQALYDEGA